MGLFFFSYQVLILHPVCNPLNPANQILISNPHLFSFAQDFFFSFLTSEEIFVSLVKEKILHKGYFSSPLYTKLCNPNPFGPVKTFFAYDFRT